MKKCRVFLVDDHPLVREALGRLLEENDHLLVVGEADNAQEAPATGDPPRDVIFEHTIRQRFKTAVYFKQVYLLAKRLGFHYAHAFRLVAGQAGAQTVKSLLLRFASALGSGESEPDFLLQESRIEREKYTGEYTRGVESLQKWGDAYAAFLVSSTLIVVVALISTMLYDLGTGFILLLTGAMFLLTGFGVFIIHVAAPYEIVTYRSGRGPEARSRAPVLFRVLVPPGGVVAGYLALTQDPGLAFIAIGVSLIPASVYAFLDDSRVSRADQEVASFVRALGNVTASLGTTLTVALNSIDTKSMGALEPYLARLQTRLNSRLSPKVCWERFTDEVGSELVDRTSRMFVDGVALGGSPDTVGAIARDYAMNIALLRANRYATALPFAFLVVPLHAAMTALLIFILEIMRAFNAHLVEATQELVAQGSDLLPQLPNLPAFQPKEMGMVTNITLIVVVVLTVANSLVPKLATGGHILKLLVYAPVMCIASGVNLVIIPPLAGGLLSLRRCVPWQSYPGSSSVKARRSRWQTPAGLRRESPTSRRQESPTSRRQKPLLPSCQGS